jgi:hypothetical protein
MGLKQKVFFDAGSSTDPQMYRVISNANLNDQGGRMTHAPESGYAIAETNNFVFTNKIVGSLAKNINIADGERRPGTPRSMPG